MRLPACSTPSNLLSRIDAMRTRPEVLLASVVSPYVTKEPELQVQTKSIKGWVSNFHSSNEVIYMTCRNLILDRSNSRYSTL